MNISRIKDRTGQTFGSLTAISFSHAEKNQTYWNYKCICGNTHIARGNTVAYVAKKGDPEIPSCGCVELRRKTKHGFRTANNTHPLYKAYRGIMDRCYNSNSPQYKFYGARGVTIASEWFNNPEAFIRWGLENGWKEGLTIDKDIKSKEHKLPFKIYSPQTCQFIPIQQNTRASTNRNNYGNHPNIRLSHQDVEEICHLYSSGTITNMSEIARRYGLKSPSSIRRLLILGGYISGKVKGTYYKAWR